MVRQQQVEKLHFCCSEEKKVTKGLWSTEEDEWVASHITRFGVSCSTTRGVLLSPTARPAGGGGAGRRRGRGRWRLSHNFLVRFGR